jgi:hypothetical protein
VTQAQPKMPDLLAQQDTARAWQPGRAGRGAGPDPEAAVNGRQQGHEGRRASRRQDPQCLGCCPAMFVDFIARVVDVTEGKAKRPAARRYLWAPMIAVCVRSRTELTHPAVGNLQLAARARMRALPAVPVHDLVERPAAGPGERP